jgi:hypothetical protein
MTSAALIMIARDAGENEFVIVVSLAYLTWYLIKRLLPVMCGHSKHFTTEDTEYTEKN